MSTPTVAKISLDNRQMRKLEKLIRKAIHEEFTLLRLQLLPFVSDEEQADIEKRYGSAEKLREGEYIDVTDRVATLCKR